MGKGIIYHTKYQRLLLTGLPNIKKLPKSEYRKYLKCKFIEESKELVKTKTKKDLLNKVADIYELILATTGEYGLLLVDVKSVASKKRKKRGGFNKHLLFKSVKKVILDLKDR